MAGTANIMWLSTVPNTVVISGLVLYLDPHNPSSYSGSGTVMNDLSGNSNTATLSTTGTLLPIYNASSYFNYAGTTSNDPYLNIPASTSINNLGAMTVSMWLRFSTTTTYNHTLFYKSDNNGTAGWFLEYAGNIGGSGLYGYSMCVVGSTDARYAIGQSQITLGVWLNIVTTWNGVFPSPTINHYINGVLNVSTPIVNTTGSGTHNTDAAVNLQFAKFQTTGSSAADFEGDAGVLQIYNRVLSSSEILQNFNAIRGIYGI